MKFGNSGFEKLGWFSRLKNSARSVMLTCSVSAVSLKTEKLNSLKLGAIRELRPSSPKWRVPATQLLSSVAPGSRVGFQVQGAANADRLRYCAGLLEYCGVAITSGRSNPSPAPE